MTPEEKLEELRVSSKRLKWLMDHPHLIQAEWIYYKKVVKAGGKNLHHRPYTGDPYTDAAIKLMNNQTEARTKQIVEMFELVKENIGICLLSEHEGLRRLADFILEEEDGK